MHLEILDDQVLPVCSLPPAGGLRGKRLQGERDATAAAGAGGHMEIAIRPNQTDPTPDHTIDPASG